MNINPTIAAVILFGVWLSGCLWLGSFTVEKPDLRDSVEVLE